MPEDDVDHTATHRPDTDSNVTLVRSANADSPASVAVGVPGFEIESTLGRGGMGVVYKATQTGLNRVVALKMLIAGQYADPSSRARFLLEAESVAALEHPHIIRVFAFGESGGHPYLAMEYVPGGTLAARVKADGPLAAPAATELLAKLAAAVAHAHSRGVVHRDIKPLNVLLTADGEPRLSDFGLAKVGRVDQNLSVTGQVLGTPAYMAPEQAAGKVHEVGTAADVYALGGVLYDLLTGRPPFTGDSAAVTLQKVISEEPARPRKLNASIPRDLETICLKCLEKDPARRYATAQALADDLLRYARNEPISARPAGARERAFKWVKRNKVVAGALTAVALALLVGAGVSVGFGLVAQQQAVRADRERDDAIAARNALKDKNDELALSQQRTNRNFAKALLGPIRAHNLKKLAALEDEALSPYEVDSLWQVAELRRDDTPRIFLEEAIRTPATSAQLMCRAEYALHAVVGLDRARRDVADRLMLSLLRDPNTKAEIKVYWALALSRAGDAPPEAATHAAGILIEALARETNAGGRGTLLAKGLLVLTARMDSSAAAKVCAPAARSLIEAITKETGFYASGELVDALIPLTARIAPGEAAQIRTQTASVLTQKIVQERDTTTRRDLVLGLARLAERMESAEAAQVCAPVARSLAEVIAKETDTSIRSNLTYGVVALAERMEPAEAARLLTEAIAKETDASTRATLAVGLAAVVSRMESAQAAQMCAPVARALAEALAKEPDSLTRDNLAVGLAALVERMEPAQAAQVCTQAARALAETLTKETNANTRDKLATRLARLAERMEPAEAARILTEALAKETDSLARGTLATGLTWVVPRMEPAQAAQMCAPVARSLAEALAKQTDSFTRNLLAYSLVALAERMEPTEAARILSEAIAKETYVPACRALASGLASVCKQMELTQTSPVCAEAARTLLAALAKETDASEVRGLVSSLMELAERIRPAEAAQVRVQTARRLMEARTGGTVANDIGELAQGLAEVAERMEPTPDTEVRAQAARAFTDSIANVRNADARHSMAEGLSGMAAGLPTDNRKWSQHTTLVATGSFATPYNLLPSLPLLHPHFHPQPKPLPAQTLVELLKHPFCVGEARRAVLDALAITYNRPFKDQWEFVEYAQKHQPQLDLLTPPKRSQPQP